MAEPRVRTRLDKEEEKKFRKWYARHAKKLKLDANPDHPLHKYDYRGAYKTKSIPDKTGHWPSRFKDADHPRRYIGGKDTRK